MLVCADHSRAGVRRAEQGGAPRVGGSAASGERRLIPGDVVTATPRPA